MTRPGKTEPPSGLTVELLRGPQVADITDTSPEFGWVTHSAHRNDVQCAYRIRVSTNPEALRKDGAETWDSGRVESEASVNVEYAGEALAPRGCYCWKVKTWTRAGGESPWSDVQKFTMSDAPEEYSTTRYPLCRTEVSPCEIVKKGEGHYLIDFGKVAFGWLRLDLPARDCPCELEVHFGERGDRNGVNRKPGGTVRYYRVVQAVGKDARRVDVHPPIDERNTGDHAIKLPPEIGSVAPFRYVELVNAPADLAASMVRQVAVHYPFDEDASAFDSSDPLLNDIWALCKYSMKATSFAGVYVDGDRERIPYEADAYINQLSHYAVDREYTLARYSHEYLLEHPTWPTEWKQHSVLMAWADYMYTGNTASLARNYDVLRSEKTLEQRARADGLLDTEGLRDIVDWPEGERDDFDFTNGNTVVNAFYCATLAQMADTAAALGKDDDAAEYREKADRAAVMFHNVFFDEARGVYVDGEGSEHASLHANMMPLAFRLVPAEHVKSVGDFVVARGMACSVYGAQYLLEALYHAGRADVALERMTSRDLRSWYNMLRVGSTITLEAWDDAFKPNQDWNHAWGAAPGNIISRYLLGVRPLAPGFAKALIQPQPASLRRASAVVPTIRGPIEMAFENEPDTPFTLTLRLPVNVTARVGLPRRGGSATTVVVDGTERNGEIDGDHLFVDGIGSGKHELSCG